MFDKDHVSVARYFARIAHFAIASGSDRRPFSSPNSYPVVLSSILNPEF